MYARAQNGVSLNAFGRVLDKVGEIGLYALCLAVAAANAAFLLVNCFAAFATPTKTKKPDTGRN